MTAGAAGPLEDARPAARATFCGYCGARPRPQPRAGESTRVCAECRLGLLLEASAAVAPSPAAAFVVVDDLLRLRAVSRAAEQRLRLIESGAVGRPLAEVLVPADLSAGAHALRWSIVGRMFGGRDGPPLELVVRPAGLHGVRYAARAGACEPGPAALIVLEPLSA